MDSKVCGRLEGRGRGDDEEEEGKNRLVRTKLNCDCTYIKRKKEKKMPIKPQFLFLFLQNNSENLQLREVYPAVAGQTTDKPYQANYRGNAIELKI